VPGIVDKFKDKFMEAIIVISIFIALIIHEIELLMHYRIAYYIILLVLFTIIILALGSMVSHIIDQKGSMISYIIDQKIKLLDQKIELLRKGECVYTRFVDDIETYLSFLFRILGSWKGEAYTTYLRHYPPEENDPPDIKGFLNEQRKKIKENIINRKLKINYLFYVSHSNKKLKEYWCKKRVQDMYAEQNRENVSCDLLYKVLNLDIFNSESLGKEILVLPDIVLLSPSADNTSARKYTFIAFYDEDDNFKGAIISTDPHIYEMMKEGYFDVLFKLAGETILERNKLYEEVFRKYCQDEAETTGNQ